MRRPLTKTEYILSALFAMIAAFPLATATEGEWLDIQPIASLTQRERLQIVEDQRAQDRLIMQVREECEERVREHPDALCPDVNDRRAVRLFLRGRDIAPDAGTGSAIEETETGALRMPIIRVLDLGDSERAMLRRFRRNGRCPANLDIVFPGFQRLCSKEVREAPAPAILRGIFRAE